ncbi:unnamed protein product [Prorocentrum cordatum]|uniref:Uncharacterized protein n=1 Tax=Prorocentrum cordatum TaxID=2364126 RepID=A0ABN9X5V8_9DINO|nr:unnamed protein product [Polarella glacialis]
MADALASGVGNAVANVAIADMRERLASESRERTPPWPRRHAALAVLPHEPALLLPLPAQQHEEDPGPGLAPPGSGTGHPLVRRRCGAAGIRDHQQRARLQVPAVREAVDCGPRILVPSVWDFIKFVGAYDESLQHHQERAEEEVSNLIQQINDQVSEMQVVCGKLTESADDFASRAFTQSRERFEKFILDIQRFYKELYQDDLLVQQLRAFIYKWFTTYCQSLLDQEPTLRRRAQGGTEELDKCRTVEEVCGAATKRLSLLKCGSRIGLVQAHSFQIPSSSSQARELAAIGDAGLEEGASFSGSIISNGSAASVASSTRKCGVRWLRFGRTGCGRMGPRTRDGARVNTDWPLRVGFLCGNITILSRRHLNHLMYLVLDLLLIGWELVNQQTYTMLLVIANFACVVSTLACFEQIDEIAKLQQRIARYQTKAEKVKEDFKKATDDWERIQQLHDLWNYRTMPFLAIMGKIHHALDDMDREISHEGPRNDKRLVWLEHANQCLEALDMKLGQASDWTVSGQEPLADEWKATIGRQLKNAERSDNVDELIESLPLLTNPKLATLEDARLQVPSGSSSRRMSSPAASPPPGGRSPAASPPPSRR